MLHGVVVAWAVAGDAQILELAVSSTKRRQGIGGLLLEAAVAAASKPGGLALLECRESNAAARSLYARHGFEVVGTRKKYYHDNEAAVLYTRQIN